MTVVIPHAHNPVKAAAHARSTRLQRRQSRRRSPIIVIAGTRLSIDPGKWSLTSIALSSPIYESLESLGQKELITVTEKPGLRALHTGPHRRALGDPTRPARSQDAVKHVLRGRAQHSSKARPFVLTPVDVTRRPARIH